MNVLPVAFAYKPKGRDSVFGRRPSEKLAIIEWENGSMHVVGGLDLPFKGAGWAITRGIAQDVVQAKTGIAYEHMDGHVGVVVPADKAFEANEFLSRFCKDKALAAKRQDALYEAGLIALVEGSLDEFVPVEDFVHPPLVEALFYEQKIPDRKPKLLVDVYADSDEFPEKLAAICVPVDWGLPRIADDQSHINLEDVS